ncbi:Ankyrin repeat-containing protein [Spatholobus suberectus]|nr:Ankyrin repeat-containing protein [Spatholobus suberectus]
MSMDNDDDIEMSYPRGEGPSRNAIDETEPTDEAEAHDLGYMSKETYDLIKDNKSESFWRDIGSDIFLQESPMGDSVLHIAALYGNDNCAKSYLRNFSYLYIKNANCDTALHVAARAGRISTLETLFGFVLDSVGYSNSEYPIVALDEILLKNRQGNTFFHEALLNGHKDVMKILGSLELKVEAGFLELVERVALFWTNNEEKSVLHLAIEKGYKDIVDRALTKLTSQHPALDKLIENQELAGMIPRALPPVNVPAPRIGIADMKIMERWKEWSQQVRQYQVLSQDSTIYKSTENLQKPANLIPYGSYYVPPGKSPLILAILKQDQDILRIILKKKKEWIYLRDNEGRTAFHYAASIGYLNGVKELLGSCISCHVERDIDGLFPLHLAAAGGHVEVVERLLEHCPDPREILDNYGRNIVHIAAQMGRLNVVRYILQNANHGLVKMINDKDANGNTPLHLATLHCHPKTVRVLTWDKRVDLSLVNRENQTALDAYMQFLHENPPLPQRLIWIALESAGVKYAKRGPHSITVLRPLQSAESVGKQKAPNMDPYKDRINTLMLVSTLITTVTFTAGFTLPGGTKSSNPGQGMAVMLHHVWFMLFVFCTTISMYGAISVTIILIWAQLGDITLALFALKLARPLLGVTLATLSVAFLAGVHLVISDLSWLATAFVVLCVISMLMLLLLYTILWFPSSSSNPVIRYISYYPFQFLTWLVEQNETEVATGTDELITCTR